jgi:hypothetical protein
LSVLIMVWVLVDGDGLGTVSRLKKWWLGYACS